MEKSRERILRLLTFYLFILATNSIWSQGFLSQNSTYHSLTSENGIEYVLKISLPYNYDKSREYNSVYYLDGFGMSDIVLGANSILNVYEQCIEDLVYIGISYGGSRDNWIEKRTYDYTPIKFKSLGKEKLNMADANSKIKVKVKYKTEGFELSENTTGGGQAFLHFIDKAILPFVNETYKNLSNSKTLIGHSFGGLFAVYSLQTKPELFDNYIIISASLSINSSELLHKSRFDMLKNCNSNIKIFNSYGGLEPNITQQANDTLSNILAEKSFKNIKYHLKNYKKEDHTSILKDAIYDGIKFIYKK